MEMNLTVPLVRRAFLHELFLTAYREVRAAT